jgi:hypothetical protein
MLITFMLLSQLSDVLLFSLFSSEINNKNMHLETHLIVWLTSFVFKFCYSFKNSDKEFLFVVS